jgi:hypothetical protein
MLTRNFFLIAATATLMAWITSTTRAAATLSLAGEWRFRIDEQKHGAIEQWFAADLTGQQRISLHVDQAGFETIVPPHGLSLVRLSPQQP